MPEPKVGDSVLYAGAKGHPDQAAVIAAVGVDDDDAGSRLTDCWLTVFAPGAAPYATTSPIPYDADGKQDTWRWADDAKPKPAAKKTTAA